MRSPTLFRRSHLRSDDGVEVLDAGAVYHTLKDPIAVLGHALRDLRNFLEDLAPPDKLESLAIGEEQVRILGDLLKGLEPLLGEHTAEKEKVGQSIELTSLVRPWLDTQRRLFEQEHRGLRLHAVPNRLVVEGNPEMILLALDNVLGNARKYSPEGRTTNVTLCRDETHRFALIRVTNQNSFPGHGLSVRLFEPWVRGQGTRRIPGLGLGLHTVQRVMKWHGGEVELHADTATDEEAPSQFSDELLHEREIWLPGLPCRAHLDSLVGRDVEPTADGMSLRKRCGRHYRFTDGLALLVASPQTDQVRA